MESSFHCAALGVSFGLHSPAMRFNPAQLPSQPGRSHAEEHWVNSWEGRRVTRALPKMLMDMKLGDK